jgi:hypothetical protein
LHAATHDPGFTQFLRAHHAPAIEQILSWTLCEFEAGGM